MLSVELFVDNVRISNENISIGGIVKVVVMWHNFNSGLCTCVIISYYGH